MSEAQGPVRTGTRGGPEAADREPGAGRGTTGPVTQAIPLSPDAAPQAGAQTGTQRGAQTGAQTGAQPAAGQGDGGTVSITKGAAGKGKDGSSAAAQDGGRAAAAQGPATSTIPRTGATPAQQSAAPQSAAPQSAARQSAPPQAPRPAGPAQGPSAGGQGTTGAVPLGAGAPTGPTGQRPAGPPTGEQSTGARVRNAVRGAGGRGPRRAKLQLRHIDTWSALKISLFLSIVLFCVWMVAVGILYGILSGLGVFDTLNDLFGQLGSAGGSGGGGDLITPGIVFGGAAVIGAVNVVLLTALSTIAAFIYNLGSDLMGGLEVTLSERD